ncbi:hypothetical protein HBA54_04860 [Pelagibius litoralis]|uniref:Uncharacterized protein n=1 Tax=Pelagibius litoralis TaxID=374515 RepID=A0A967C5P8_9PROT|nr:hypothetical protein [Pelagibius litoralis]NIA67916.1 hypothetical protein [Pelagibius litoralis]
MNVKGKQWWEPQEVDLTEDQAARVKQAGADAFAALLARIENGQIKRASGEAHGGAWIGR